MRILALKIVINTFSKRFRISGLLKTWSSLDEPYGAILGIYEEVPSCFSSLECCTAILLSSSRCHCSSCDSSRFFFLVFLFFCPVYLCVNVCLLCTWLISAPAFNHLISCRTATFLPFFTTPLNQLQWFHLLCGSLLHFCKFASSPRALCNTITCPPHDFPVLLLPPQL